jgi:hypothetical protein
MPTMNNWLFMYGGWTMYFDQEHCMVDELTDVWCLLVLTFDVRQMNYVWWIIVVYIFSFWYWLLMDNGCVYICLVYGTDFWWMMVVNVFIICLRILMDNSRNGHMTSVARCYCDPTHLSATQPSMWSNKVELIVENGKQHVLHINW